MRKALVAANWKMNGSVAQLEDYLASLQLADGVDVVLLPPAVYLPVAMQAAPAAEPVACTTPRRSLPHKKQWKTLYVSKLWL